jgi:hypothetical protein
MPRSGVGGLLVQLTRPLADISRNIVLWQWQTPMCAVRSTQCDDMFDGVVCGIGDRHVDRAGADSNRKAP